MASSSSRPSDSTFASSSKTWNYDVFISFRGKDTRKTFVDHLYSALVQQGIHTYKDDETLVQGESIAPSLTKAIKESRIAIIVFSKNYADSTWCLDELAYIMKCMNKRGQIVMPIFYDVDPSEVRKQDGKYEEACAKYELKNYNKAQIWKNALADVGNLSGWVLKNIANGHESKFIKEMVDKISDRLFSLVSNVDKDLVGMATRLQDLKLHLEIGSFRVRMVGIWGVGGGGKTTLATSVYKEIHHQFEGHCFVENIREESSKSGLKKLQGQMLSAILKTQIVVHSGVEGRSMIKSRLCHKKVLIVLDDVDSLEQLESLVGSHDWFGDGSRIIITTRNEHLLKTHGVDTIHAIRLLSQGEGFQLFHRHAYRESKVIKDYKTLSRDVVSYAGGLPLALKILGSFLCDKDKNEWVSALAKLKKIPNPGIMETLKLSYDGLEPDEKELFLDIACFWRGMTQSYVMRILDACGFHPIIGENDKIEALYAENTSHLHKLVENLKKLRFLYVYPPYGDQEYGEAPTYLSNELRYLHWQDYLGNSFPDDFHPTKLVILCLTTGLQRELWNGYKYLPCLKEIDLHCMGHLVATPDFDGLPCLVKLSLSYCCSLQVIHPSLGRHRNLVKIHIKMCDSLKGFPDIIQLKKLETLKIICCSQLYKFPVIQSKMDSLVKLAWNHTGVSVLPPSIRQCCTNLLSLSLDGLSTRISNRRCLVGIGSSHLPCFLRKLNLGWCNLLDGDIPYDIGELSNLQELGLHGNPFSRLRCSLLRLTRLRLLNLTFCRSLVELPKLPSSIAILMANSCYSLKTIENFQTNCKWLCQVSLLKGNRDIGGERILRSMLQGNAMETRSIYLQLEGLEIPKGFKPSLLKGTRFRLQLPPNWYDDFSGFLMCAVLTRGYNLTVNISMRYEMDDSVHMDSQWEEGEHDEVTWVGYVSFGSLRDSTWWDSSYSAITFSLHCGGEETSESCTGLAVALVPARKSESNPMEATINHLDFLDETDSYAHKFAKRGDSKSALEISHRMW
ncbi:NB-ARC domains-containing protein [Artemisia annua]|uniref:NB-ARC domains-containing protein n=1 Tax=Artemisia annua TaxID=35608 RepID=A0A2U1QMT9_ARTAN|nr:NB-ARC domains-containing protein [Artemisia annua]